jgi:DnaD/phage-associated family protein
MSNVIHGASHKALKFMRKEPAALSVYWVYISRTNAENVSYPSLRGLANDTGWAINTCKKAREWLVAHKALEEVAAYVRPEWRTLHEDDRALKENLDRAEYYRPTGKIVVDGVTYSMLYFGKSEDTGIEEYDVLPHDTSPDAHVSPDDTSPCITPLHVAPDDTELSTSKEQLDSTTTTTPPVEKSNIIPLLPAVVVVEELSPDAQKVCKAYESNIGPLAPMITDAIKTALNDYPAEWLIDAIGIAVTQNARKWVYVKGVLKRWKTEGKSDRSGKSPLAGLKLITADEEIAS